MDMHVTPTLRALITDLKELSEYVQEARRIIEKANVHIFLEEDEAAQLLRIKVEELRQRRLKGKQPFFFKIGKHVRYSLLDLLDYIKSCRRRSTSEQAHSQDGEYHA
jgi:hypothetical protein